MDVTEDLTARQREVLAALERLTADRGYPPTLRELGAEVGLSSASSVWAHVHVLEEAELIARQPGRPRTTRSVRASGT